MIQFKWTFLLLILMSATNSLFGQTVNVDGFVYLENQVSHDNVQIVFKRIVPSTLSDTAYTNSSGYFTKTIEQGTYTVYYSKPGFITDSIVGEALYSNITLQSDTLAEAGLCGLLSGVISAGTYKVGCDIEVASGDTLILEPGVKLMFEYMVEFTINGLLLASGTEADSIYFTKYAGDTRTWKGVKINDASNDNTIISYARIEYSHDKGIEVYNASPQLLHLVLENNTGAYYNDQNSDDAGAGIYLDNSSPTLKNIVFKNNYARAGSCIKARSSVFEIIDCEFINNDSFLSAAIGLWYYSVVEITNSIIRNNTRTFIPMEGGASGVRVDMSTLVVRNSIVANNQHAGIEGFDAKIKSINTLYTNNNGFDVNLWIAIGEGIKVEDSELNVINSIFTNHESYGIGNYPTNTVKVNRSCFWNNKTAFMFAPSDFIGDIVTVNMNGDSCDAYLNIFEDPLLNDTSTMDFTLNMSSPCIDAGINDSIDFSSDLIGNMRIFDGKNDNDTIVDMGPYEFGSIPVPEPEPEDPTGLFEKTAYNDVEMYPNPSNGKFTLVNGQSVIDRIEIYNLLGEKNHEAINVNQHTIHEVDISGFPRGLYFVKIYSGANAYTMKMIVQ